MALNPGFLSKVFYSYEGTFGSMGGYVDSWHTHLWGTNAGRNGTTGFTKAAATGYFGTGNWDVYGTMVRSVSGAGGKSILYSTGTTLPLVGSQEHVVGHTSNSAPLSTICFTLVGTYSGTKLYAAHGYRFSGTGSSYLGFYTDDGVGTELGTCVEDIQRGGWSNFTSAYTSAGWGTLRVAYGGGTWEAWWQAPRGGSTGSHRAVYASGVSYAPLASLAPEIAYFSSNNSNRAVFHQSKWMASIPLGHGSLWPSWEPDSLVMGDRNIERPDSVCTRLPSGQGYQPGLRAPSGCPGSIPAFFSSSGSHRALLQILDTHFQNFAFATPVGARANTFSFSALTTALPEAWHGMTFIKDSGITSQTFSYEGGICETLELSWTYGNPLMLKPTYQFLRGTDVACGSTVGSSIPGMGLMTGLYSSFTWSGATIYPVSINIQSKNEIAEMSYIGTKSRQGFALGKYNASITLSIWNDDYFGSYYLQKARTSEIGTLIFNFNGSLGTYSSGTAFGCYGIAYCKIKTMPSLPNRRTANPDKILLEAVSPDGTTKPFTFVVYSDYSYTDTL